MPADAQPVARHGVVGLLLATLLIIAMYTVQGSIVGLAEGTLPQLLSRGGTSLMAMKILAIVKLPAATKVFFAPFVDFASLKTPFGHGLCLLVLQGLSCASLFALSPLTSTVESVGGEAAAVQLRWPLFGAAACNALGDLALDAFALSLYPERLGHLPALCQVLGVFVGKTHAKAGFFFAKDHGWLTLPSFVAYLAWVTLGCSLCVAFIMTSQRRTPEGEKQDALSMAVLVKRTWAFTVERPNMSHWLLYQFVVPALYFHVLSVLNNRYEQLGMNGEDYAAYELPFAGLTVVLMCGASQMASDSSQPLIFFLRVYFVEVLLVVGLLVQYCFWPGQPTAAFAFAYAAMNKLQDLLFFVFEVGEFAFYGRVAKLEPALVASLVTLQACTFNFADFFHSWLAPLLVDMFSSCTGEVGQVVCKPDAYVPVAACLIALGLGFILTQWRTIVAYQDLKHPGWTPQQPAPLWSRALVVSFLAGICIFVVQEFLQVY